MTPRQLSNWLLHPMVPQGQDTPVPRADTKHITYNVTNMPQDAHEPDCLKVMGRDVAQHVWSHPEQYQRGLFGIRVLVVDDAGYDALFYLYAGMTQDHVHNQTGSIVSLMFNDIAILSREMYEEIIRAGGHHD